MSTDIVETTAETMSVAPLINTMDGERLKLLMATVAKNATAAEVGVFLEVAKRYDLDPFAKEIWCAKGDKPGDRVLIMVGRDGLRKIAHRRGLRMDCDVVRAKDTFSVQRGADRSRVVEHTYAGGIEQRGPIIGAWAEVYDPATGDQLSYFYAPIAEYRPKSEAKLKYSPWGSQESVMILAAAERQALRQATPLSGVVAEGEGEINAENAAAAPPEPARVNTVDKELVAMLREIVEAGTWTINTQNLRLVQLGAQDTSTLEASVATMPPDAAAALKVELEGLLAPAEAEVVA